MKFSAEVKINVGEDGIITLREPTNAEWNNFAGRRYPISKKGKIIDNSMEARTELFDVLVLKIENIEDTRGPITIETKERIPARIKSAVIFHAFEAEEIVETKNLSGISDN